MTKQTNAALRRQRRRLLHQSRGAGGPGAVSRLGRLKNIDRNRFVQEDFKLKVATSRFRYFGISVADCIYNCVTTRSCRGTKINVTVNNVTVVITDYPELKSPVSTASNATTSPAPSVGDAD